MAKKSFVLQPNHPTHVKLLKVWALMDKLGISIELGDWGYVFVDDESESERFSMKDLEYDGSAGGHVVAEFPPKLEYKLTFEKDEDKK